MSEMKRKYFSFEEEELVWINPLLVEWSKENEGKPQSDLVLQLLKDYRDREPPLKETMGTAASSMKEKLSDYSTRSKDALDGVIVKSKDGLQTVQSKVQSGGTKLMDQIRKVESNVRTKLEDIKAERKEPDDDPEEV
jgi:gas vesicle protein